MPYSPFLPLTPRNTQIPLKDQKEFGKKLPLDCTRQFIHGKYLDIEDVKDINNGCHSTMIILAGLHNETINIYTHLIPIFVIIFEMVMNVWLTETVNIATNTYGISMVICFLFSVYYHIGCCRIPTQYNYILTIDLFGVYLIFFVSVLSGICVGWHCQRSYQIIYSTINCVVFVFILFPMLFIYGNAIAFYWKKLVFALMFVFELIPMCHWIYLYHELLALFWYGPLFMFGGYFVGGIIWHYRVPEVFCPGKFDIFGHSHQWWHICIVIASFSWWYALNDLSNYWNTVQC